MKNVHMRDLFAKDAERFGKFSLEFSTGDEGKLLLDYSKNIITERTVQLLLDLAAQAEVPAWTKRMFAGEKINITEQRAVLHVALRNRSNTPIYVAPASCSSFFCTSSSSLVFMFLTHSLSF